MKSGTGSRQRPLRCYGERLWSRFWIGRTGGIAVVFALLLPVLVGGLALAIDMSRLSNLQTELQDVVDAAALAGATQLDLTPGSRTRAVQAAASEATRIIENSQRFADAYEEVVAIEAAITDAAGVISTPNIQFYSDLASKTVATSDENATFIEITITPRQVTYYFAGIVSDTLNSSPNARAVAGYEETICGPQPMFICNPEGDTDADGASEFFDVDLYVGHGLFLKDTTGGGPNDAPDVPGEFGFLEVIDPDDGDLTQQNAVICEALASSNPQSFCLGTGVNGKPGQVTSLGDCLNVRFDIYPESGQPASWISDVNDEYPPDRNVTRGLEDVSATKTNFNVTGQGGDGYARPGDNDASASSGQTYDGTETPTTDPLADTLASYSGLVGSFGFPRDICAYGGACDAENGGLPLVDDMSDGGTWDIETYARVNHSTFLDTNTASAAYLASNAGDYAGALQNEIFNVFPNDVVRNPDGDVIDQAASEPGNGELSRHEVYLWEILSGNIPTAPDNYSGASSTGVDGRRIITVVVVDCVAAPNNGQDMPTGPGDDAIDIFLTEPIGAVSENNLYAEIVGPSDTTGLTTTTARRRVVLYE